MSWEPPLESDPGAATIEALFELNVKLGDIGTTWPRSASCSEEYDDGEEEEEAD
ncbi:MAG TPA: hypothetical protein VH760_08175 [Gaiellaceae bacterium]